MPHPDPGTPAAGHADEQELALIALGEAAPARVADHLLGCSACRAQLDGLRRVVAEARSLGESGSDGAAAAPGSPDVTEGSQVRPVPPPDHVWTAVADATGTRVHARSDRVRAATGSMAELVPELGTGSVAARGTARNGVPRAPRRPVRRPVTATLPGVDDFTTEPLPDRARSGARRRSVLTGLAVAAALLLGLFSGAGGVLALQRWGREPAASAPAVLVRTTLTALSAAPSAGGSADVVQTGDNRVLQITVRRLGPPDGYYEVWLGNPGLTSMISVGLLQDDRGTFQLPADVDLSTYRTVDVSLEPMDGNPAHSTKSVLRGTLRT